ncbi:MAG: multicopper oxidase domain-containing protein [Candidatus Kariarchaeaceae archaeon]
MSNNQDMVKTVFVAALVSILVGSISGVSFANMVANNQDPLDVGDHGHNDVADHGHNDLAEFDHDHEVLPDQMHEYHFELQAFFEGYIGTSGDILDAVNPTLQVLPYSNVTITLTAGDFMPHDFVIDELSVQSDEVELNEVEELVFNFIIAADEDGTFVYYCSIAGHYATMNGQFIVGEGQAIEQARDLDKSVIKDPVDIPAPVGARAPQDIEITIVTREVTAKLDEGTSYTFWTFNGTVPGPLIRVRVGDNVTIHLQNEAESDFVHSIDFHAVNADGGGAAFTQAAPGTTESFWFIPEWEGVFVYHCASPHVPTHISKGMYGAISIEPAAGLPAVDKEFYVGQHEMYTTHPKGTRGHQEHSDQKQLREEPDYVVFNGQVNALTQPEYELKVNTNDTVRLFFAVGGPNVISNFHLIGGVWDRVYYETDWTEPNMFNAETIPVTPGSALAIEIDITREGLFILVDHALTRTFDKGCLGYMRSTDT